MSDKATIEFKLDNFKGVIEGNTDDKQPEANHYRKIQKTKEGQDLIQELVKVINSIENIDSFTNALKSYIRQYAILKEKHPSSNFKIRDIEFDYNNKKCTLNEIIAVSFHDNDTLINLYNGIINQFDRVCGDLDKVFNIKYKLDSFEHFMNNLSLQTISPLTIELYANTINSQIKKISGTISKQCETQEDTDRLNACQNKFINLYNDTQTLREGLKTGLSHEEKDLAFKDNDSNNYLSLVKDKYNRNYLHYAWKHFEGVSTISDLNNIKARLSEYAGNNTGNIKQACEETDVYGLTPLCHVLINAFDSGIKTEKVGTRLGYILQYFKEFRVNIQLKQKDLQAIYDYFQITKNIRGEQRNYQEFIDTMGKYIQKTHDGKIPYVKKDKKYIPQTKFNAKTNKEQTLINDDSINIETFLSDNGGYKDKVGDFVDSLFDEMFNNNNNEFNKYFIAKDEGYENFKKFKETYILYMYTNNNYDFGAVINKIASIKVNKQLKYTSDNPTYNNSNRNNYCISLFIKALKKEYIENNNPDIMFKFLSDFCKEDMDIKMGNSNYIQIIEYFLNTQNKIDIDDNVRQNIRSLTRYMIENGEIQNFSFIKDIIGNIRISNANKQALIQDIVLTAIDNNLSFSGGNEISTPQQLAQELYNCGSSSSNTTQQDISIFTIVKNLILSGNVKENENFSQYSGLKDEEKAKLQQILAKTVAVTKIIKEGKQDCSKLRDAVVKFVGGNTGLTIEDIAKIKIMHKSIVDFCEGKISTNKKYAYYSWFLNKLVVNDYITKNPIGNELERNGSREQLIPTAQQTIIPEKQVILDTYKDFEDYKGNVLKKSDASLKPHNIFQVSYMNNYNQTTRGKRSIVNYQDIKPIYNYEETQDEYDYQYGSEQNKTLKSIVGNETKEDIKEDLKKYKLQQQVALNQEKSDKFKRFCIVFDLIKANTSLFNAIKGINATTAITRSQTTQGGYNPLD